jgi:hypothetical protein
LDGAQVHTVGICQGQGCCASGQELGGGIAAVSAGRVLGLWGPWPSHRGGPSSVSGSLHLGLAGNRLVLRVPSTPVAPTSHA